MRKFSLGWTGDASGCGTIALVLVVVLESCMRGLLVEPGPPAWEARLHGRQGCLSLPGEFTLFEPRQEYV